MHSKLIQKDPFKQRSLKTRENHEKPRVYLSQTAI